MAGTDQMDGADGATQAEQGGGTSYLGTFRALHSKVIDKLKEALDVCDQNTHKLGYEIVYGNAIQELRESFEDTLSESESDCRLADIFKAAGIAKLIYGLKKTKLIQGLQDIEVPLRGVVNSSEPINLTQEQFDTLFGAEGENGLIKPKPAPVRRESDCRALNDDPNTDRVVLAVESPAGDVYHVRFSQDWKPMHFEEAGTED